jgi:protein-disulfide isomerase
MNKYFILILLCFIVSSCSEEKDPKSPAEEQIKEYTSELQECELASAEKTDSADANHTATEHKNEQEATPEKSTSAVSIKDFTIASDDMFIGDKDAKVIIVEYYSPTCPHCVSYHKRTFPEIKAKYIDTNKIAYVFREFIGTKQDLDASILARCTGDTATYVKFMDVILQQQDNWIFNKNYREILTNIGQLGGVSAEQYANCLNNEKNIQALLENTRLAAKSPRFIGTPTFFINGEHFTKPYTFEELSKAIDESLK